MGDRETDVSCLQGGPIREPRGPHQGPTGAPSGNHGGPIREPRGPHQGTTGASSGNHGGLIREPRGPHQGTTEAAGTTYPRPGPIFYAHFEFWVVIFRF